MTYFITYEKGADPHSAIRLRREVAAGGLAREIERLQGRGYTIHSVRIATGA